MAHRSRESGQPILRPLPLAYGLELGFTGMMACLDFEAVRHGIDIAAQRVELAHRLLVQSISDAIAAGMHLAGAVEAFSGSIRPAERDYISAHQRACKGNSRQDVRCSPDVPYAARPATREHRRRSEPLVPPNEVARQDVSRFIAGPVRPWCTSALQRNRTLSQGGLICRSTCIKQPTPESPGPRS
jgi:hypothetical protein